RLTKSLVIREDECAILLDRSSQRTSELIPLERRNPRVKEISRIQGAVPQKFIDASVEGVRARARYGINDSARGPAVLGGVVASQHRKLLNGVDAEIVTQNTSWRSVRVVVDAHAIEAIVILIRPGAGNAQGCSKTALHVASALGGPRLHPRDTRLKSCELSPVTPVERRIKHRRGTDVSTGCRGSRIGWASGNGDSNHLVRVSRFHHHVEYQLRAQI